MYSARADSTSSNSDKAAPQPPPPPPSPPSQIGLRSVSRYAAAVLRTVAHMLVARGGTLDSRLRAAACGVGEESAQLDRLEACYFGGAAVAESVLSELVLFATCPSHAQRERAAVKTIVNDELVSVAFFDVLGGGNNDSVKATVERVLARIDETKQTARFTSFRLILVKWRAANKLNRTLHTWARTFEQEANHRLVIELWRAQDLQFDRAEHVLVSPHALVPVGSPQVRALAAKFGAHVLRELPQLSANDPMALYHAFEPGDLVCIERASLRAGRTRFYRLVRAHDDLTWADESHAHRAFTLAEQKHATSFAPTQSSRREAM
jgi:DNA-directed RNA polymerase subunit H (RpoH/RPB5)